MMTTDDPWSGLVAGGIDARRVDPSGRHDFFWIVSSKSEPGLLLRLGDDTAQIKPLPQMRNLDLAYRMVAGSNSLVLLLKDEEQRELFGSLCQDIVGAGEQADDNHDALNRAIRRTLRWHHLLRGGKSGLLSLEEQRGLLGELQFLVRLIDLVGPRAAIEAWKGPLGSSKDFELDGCLVEVKARRGAAKPFVQISSEDQLSDVDGCRLFLLVSAIDAVVKPNGMTLTDHVKEVEALSRSPSRKPTRSGKRHSLPPASTSKMIFPIAGGMSARTCNLKFSLDSRVSQTRLRTEYRVCDTALASMPAQISRWTLRQLMNSSSRGTVHGRTERV